MLTWSGEIASPGNEGPRTWTIVIECEQAGAAEAYVSHSRGATSFE